MSQIINKIKTVFTGRKKIAIILTAASVLIAAVYLVINSRQVTAQILPVVVNVNHLDFGTAFPGEELQRDFIVSYVQEYEYNGITYRLVQKRKPLPEGYLGEGDPEMPGFYKDLCPFLTKVSEEGEGDTETQAFVGPNDLSDTWIIYFKVPAIVGHVSQDHTGGVVTDSGDYGCDISIDIDLPTCDPTKDLVLNGDFETPVVAMSQKWDIYDSGFAGLNWLAEWYDGSTTFNGYTRPELAHLELHRGVLGNAFSGAQYAELDTDWDGPAGSLNNEPALVKIYQNLSTIPGQTYNIIFYTSPRPNTTAANNVLEFSWDGVVKDTISVAGGSSINWSQKSYTFTAAGFSTQLQFIEKGTPDSLGTFLDNVSVKCILSQ